MYASHIFQMITLFSKPRTISLAKVNSLLKDNSAKKVLCSAIMIFSRYDATMVMFPILIIVAKIKVGVLSLKLSLLSLNVFVFHISLILFE